MTDEIDIWCAVDLLVKRHGENAGIVAAQRADEMLATLEPFPAKPMVLQARERVRRKPTYSTRPGQPLAN